jgi:uncharacterized membrane protein YccF (DUF307 family)
MGPVGTISYSRQSVTGNNVNDADTSYILIASPTTTSDILVLDRATFGNLVGVSSTTTVVAVSCLGACSAQSATVLDLPVNLATERHVVLSVAPAGHSLYLKVTGAGRFDASVVWHVVK